MPVEPLCSPMPTARLQNGLVVGNFSSPHPFEFDDGTPLGACEEDRVRLGSVQPKEVLVTRISRANKVPYKVVMLEPHLGSETLKMMLDDTDFEKGVDIVIVSLMLLEAIKSFRRQVGSPDLWAKCHSIRRPERGAKVICSDRFCV